VKCTTTNTHSIKLCQSSILSAISWHLMTNQQTPWSNGNSVPQSAFYVPKWPALPPKSPIDLPNCITTILSLYVCCESLVRRLMPMKFSTWCLR